MANTTLRFHGMTKSNKRDIKTTTIKSCWCHLGKVARFIYLRSQSHIRTMKHCPSPKPLLSSGDLVLKVPSHLLWMTD